MTRPIKVKALPNFHIWLRYDDGTEGKVDLSDLAGRGVFKAWDDFGILQLGPVGGAWRDRMGHDDRHLSRRDVPPTDRQVARRRLPESPASFGGCLRSVGLTAS